MADNSLISKTIYLSGIPEFDSRVKEPPNHVSRHGVAWHYDPKNGTFNVKIGLFKTSEVKIRSESIISVRLEAREKIGQQNKSVVGRAIVGEALFGTAGAIVGGLTASTGSGRNADFFLMITHLTDPQTERVAQFSVPGKDSGDVENYFRRFIPDKFQAEVVPLANAAASQGKPDIYEQLEKLASLKEKGILSEEEFQAQKSKILA